MESWLTLFYSTIKRPNKENQRTTKKANREMRTNRRVSIVSTFVFGFVKVPM